MMQNSGQLALDQAFSKFQMSPWYRALLNLSSSLESLEEFLAVIKTECSDSFVASVEGSENAHNNQEFEACVAYNQAVLLAYENLKYICGIYHQKIESTEDLKRELEEIQKKQVAQKKIIWQTVRIFGGVTILLLSFSVDGGTVSSFVVGPEIVADLAGLGDLLEGVELQGEGGGEGVQPEGGEEGGGDNSWSQELIENVTQWYTSCAEFIENLLPFLLPLLAFLFWWQGFTAEDKLIFVLLILCEIAIFLLLITFGSVSLPIDLILAIVFANLLLIFLMKEKSKREQIIMSAVFLLGIACSFILGSALLSLASVAAAYFINNYLNEKSKWQLILTIILISIGFFTILFFGSQALLALSFNHAVLSLVFWLATSISLGQYISQKSVWENILLISTFLLVMAICLNFDLVFLGLFIATGATYSIIKLLVLSREGLEYICNFISRSYQSLENEEFRNVFQNRELSLEVHAAQRKLNFQNTMEYFRKLEEEMLGSLLYCYSQEHWVEWKFKDELKSFQELLLQEENLEANRTLIFQRIDANFIKKFLESKENGDWRNKKLRELVNKKYDYFKTERGDKTVCFYYYITLQSTAKKLLQIKRELLIPVMPVMNIVQQMCEQELFSDFEVWMFLDNLEGSLSGLRFSNERLHLLQIVQEMLEQKLLGNTSQVIDFLEKTAKILSKLRLPNDRVQLLNIVNKIVNNYLTANVDYLSPFIDALSGDDGDEDNIKLMMNRIENILDNENYQEPLRFAAATA